MKITQYLNQTAQYEERLDSLDGWGQQSFNPPITIKCRYQTKHKLLKTKAGHEFIPVTEYMTEQPLKLGDRIDGQELQAVESIQDFKRTIGWKGYPEPPSGFSGSAG